MKPLFRLLIATSIAVVALPLAPAGAAPRAGGIAVLPVRGTDQTALTVVTARACPAGTNLMVRLSGQGFPAGGQNIVGNTALNAYERTRTGGLVIPVSLVLRDIANLPAKPVTYAGTYTITVICRDRVRLPALATFSGTLRFTSPHSFVARNASVATAVAPLDTSAGSPPLLGAGPQSGPGPHAGAPGQPSTATGGGSPDVAAQPASQSASVNRHSWTTWAGLLVLVLGVAGLGISAGRAAKRRSAAAS